MIPDNVVDELSIEVTTPFEIEQPTLIEFRFPIASLSKSSNSIVFESAVGIEAGAVEDAVPASTVPKIPSTMIPLFRSF